MSLVFSAIHTIFVGCVLKPRFTEVMNILQNRIKLFAIFVYASLLTSCNDGNVAVSFYYWKSVASADALQKTTLSDNDVKRLYVRYFDVKVNERNLPIPEAPLRGTSEIFNNLEIIPVVYIKNDVFVKMSAEYMPTFVADCADLIRQMNTHFKVSPSEVQFDCDWSPSTQKPFFDFLRQFRKAYPAVLSSTIRLHQYKYPKTTGVPPVDKGVLMYYNMGKIGADTLNSVYERNTARRYLTPTTPYPLPLAVALPIFNWGIHIRGGKVVQLLSKIAKNELSALPQIERIATQRYRAKQSVFFAGIYLKQGDEIKIESIAQQQLTEMADDIKESVPNAINEVIFFDLDDKNIKKYDTQIFQKVAHHLR